MNIKKLILSAFLSATMILSFGACSSGEEEPAPTTEGETTTEKPEPESEPEEAETPAGGTLKVATEAGFAPYEYMKGDEVVGVDMDIAKAIADSLGMELEIMNMDFDGALMAVQQGKADIVAAGVTVSDERLQVMDFSTSYVDSKEVVIVNKATPAVTEATVEGLTGKVIGVQQGNIADIWVEGNVEATAKRYAQFSQAAEDLKNNKIDCILIDELPGKDLVAANPELVLLDGTIFEDKYAIGLAKENEELLAKVNEVIEQLIADGKIEEFISNHASK